MVSITEEWMIEGAGDHTNILYLMPPRLAIPTFTKGESNISIQLQIDNKAALSHLLEIGGGNCKKYLLVISKSIWQCLFQKQILITA